MWLTGKSPAVGEGWGGRLAREGNSQELVYAFLEGRGAGADAGGARLLDLTEMAPLTWICSFPRDHGAAGTIEQYCSWYEAGLVSGEGTNADGTGVSNGTKLATRSSAGAGQYSPRPYWPAPAPQLAIASGVLSALPSNMLEGSADSTPLATASCGAACSKYATEAGCAASATTLLATPSLSANQRSRPASAQGKPSGRGTCEGGKQAANRIGHRDTASSRAFRTSCCASLQCALQRGVQL